MGVFSRFADIVNANFNAILDKAEDPEKMIRLIIQEMEDTLVEVRTTSARTIAERKDLNRQLERFNNEAADWEAKAELAVNKSREDLARAALMEKKRSLETVTAMTQEVTRLDETLDKLTSEITTLQEKLNDARARQKAMVMRHSAAESRVKVRENIIKVSGAEASAKFERFERKLDEIDATIESQDLGRKNSLADEISNLEAEEQLDQELAQLKQKLSGSKSSAASSEKNTKSKSSS